MKFYVKPILSVLALAVLLTYANCGGSKNPGPSEEEVQLGKVTTTWKVGTTGNVTLDNVSKKTDYSNFTLVLTGTAGASSYSYTTSGGPDLKPWASAGSWKFGTSVSTDIIRDPGTPKELAVTYSVTDSQLQLTFNYQGAGESAKTDQVKGQWVFTLVKQ